MYEKLNLLAKNLVSKIVGQGDGMEDPGTLSRLQKISDRLARQPIGEDGETDDYLKGRLRHPATAELNVEPVIAHWSTDTGRHQRQVIRQGEQFKGAQQCFEIDPLSNLPD